MLENNTNTGKPANICQRNIQTKKKKNKNRTEHMNKCSILITVSRSRARHIINFSVDVILEVIFNVTSSYIFESGKKYPCNFQPSHDAGRSESDKYEVLADARQWKSWRHSLWLQDVSEWSLQWRWKFVFHFFCIYYAIIFLNICGRCNILFT